MKPNTDSRFPFANFQLNLVYKCAAMKMKAVMNVAVVVFLIINHTQLIRLTTALTVHTLTSVTVSLCMLIKKPHPKICPSENNL